MRLLHLSKLSDLSGMVHADIFVVKNEIEEDFKRKFKIK
jgi:hypothetical protein